MTRTTDIEGHLRRHPVALADVPEPLRSLIEMADDGASKHFRKHGYAIPQWRAITADRGMVVIADPPHENKDISAMMVRALLAIKNAIVVVFTDEAWTLAIGDGEHPLTDEQLAESERVTREGISKNPNRSEAIIFVCEDSDGHHYAGERTIIRPAKGKATLAPLRLYIPHTGEGRFASWLTPTGKPS